MKMFAPRKKTEDNVSKSVNINIQNIELPQHRNVNEEGNIRNKDERMTYLKLQNLSAQLDTTVLQNKAQSNKAFIHMTEWLGKISKEENVHPAFIQVPTQVEPSKKSVTTLLFDIDPIYTGGTRATVNRCNTRLISSTERRKMQRLLNFPQGNSLKTTGERRATVDSMYVNQDG